MFGVVEGLLGLVEGEKGGVKSRCETLEVSPC